MMRWHSTSPPVFFCLFGLLLYAAPPDGTSSQIVVATPACGPSSLYVMCRLEGVKCDLGTVEGRFPSAAPAGHSLEEIRVAAKPMGLDLRGVKAPADARLLDRPAIVFLDRGGHGHFVVIRPVGHSGHLVQVIDGGHSVETQDYSRLIATPGWTGFSLVPARPSLDPRLFVVTLALIPPLAWLVIRSFRRKRGVDRDSDPLAILDPRG